MGNWLIAAAGIMLIDMLMLSKHDPAEKLRNTFCPVLPNWLIAA
jgi:hypothetical protein